MKINEKYLIYKIIETLKDDPEYNTGSLVWWYSDSLDIMQPCRIVARGASKSLYQSTHLGTLPDLGVDDWKLVVVFQDLEYYLPNDSPNSGVKRRSGRFPWVSREEKMVVSQGLENSGVKRRSGPHPWESNKKNERLGRK